MSENTAILLYGITNKSNTELCHIKGLDENYTLLLIEKGGLYGVVSEVTLREYNEEDIGTKSEDIDWLTDKANKFMKIILSVNKDAAIIPMKFLTILNNISRVEEIMEQNIDKFSEILKKLDNKKELSVKIYCNYKVFKDTYMKEELLKFEESLKGKPKGTVFLLRKKFDSELNDKVQSKAYKIANSMVYGAAPHYVEMKSNKLLAKEITGIQDKMILNCAFLIDKKQEKIFNSYIHELIEKYSNIGFTLQFTGPWPPYNFCD